jgi:glycosyltransferase involved in cell wall biosynthesis
VVKRVAFAVPGSLATPTGGYAYDARIIDELRRLDWQVDVLDIGEGFPFPAPGTRAAAESRLGAIAEGVPIVVDGLALGVLPEVAAALKPAHGLIALVHHPLALESGLSSPQAETLRSSERAALSHASQVVVTSPSTGQQLVADYGVPDERITAAPPGTDPAKRARGGNGASVSLLAVGSLVPRKGYDVLLAALATLRELPWRLTIVGERRDTATADRIEAEIAALGFSDRVTLVGGVKPDSLSALYDESDVFVLASRHEGYGMAFAEATAHGLPVIGTTAGAIPDTVPAQAGILIPPDDISALATALRRLISDSAERARLAAGAWEAAKGLPTWQDSAKRFAQAIEAAA